MIAAATRTVTATLPTVAGEPAAAPGFDAVLGAIAGTDTAPVVGEAPAPVPVPPAPIDWEAQAAALLPSAGTETPALAPAAVLAQAPAMQPADVPDVGPVLASGPQDVVAPPAAPARDRVIVLEARPLGEDQVLLRRQEPSVGPVAAGLLPAQEHAVPGTADRPQPTDGAPPVRTNGAADPNGGAEPAAARLPGTAPEQPADEPRVTQRIAAASPPAPAGIVVPAREPVSGAPAADAPADDAARAADDGATPAARAEDAGETTEPAAPDDAAAASSTPLPRAQDAAIAVPPPASAPVATPAPAAPRARDIRPGLRTHAERRIVPDAAPLLAAAPFDSGSAPAAFVLPAAASAIAVQSPDQAMAATPDLGAQVLTHQLGAAHDVASLDRLARDIAAGAGDGPLRFALRADTLGPLGVELQRGDDGTAVRLSTASDAAHTLLSDARPQLLAQAQAQGVRISLAAVDLVPGGGAGAGGSAGDGARHPPAPPPPAFDAHDARDTPAKIIPARDMRARYA